jgi:uncharacterized protein (DUF952 family)
MERVLHVTTPETWERARAAGCLPRGTEPAADGDEFLHCCFEDQLAGVLERFYADAPGPLLVLEVEADGLDVRVEAAADGAGDFPHLHADLPVERVVDLRTLERHDGRWVRRP